MFAYKGFELERDDKYNISLYRMENVEIQDRGDRTFGRGKGTGQFQLKRVHKGFYNSFQGAVHQIAQFLAEDCQNIDEVLGMVKELNAFATAFTLPQVYKEEEEVIEE